jgi:hypothetical protein
MNKRAIQCSKCHRKYAPDSFFHHLCSYSIESHKNLCTICHAQVNDWFKHVKTKKHQNNQQTKKAREESLSIERLSEGIQETSASQALYDKISETSYELDSQSGVESCPQTVSLIDNSGPAIMKGNFVDMETLRKKSKSSWVYKINDDKIPV